MSSIYADAGWDGARVVVTGGCGFIGSHLVERLVELGSHVVAWDNERSGTRNNLGPLLEAVEVSPTDVRDLERMRAELATLRPAFIFHLAANASVPGSVEDPAYDFQANCVGTFNLLEAMRQTELDARLVIASSGAVYGQPTDFPITESSPLAPISPYGSSKLAAEIQARTYHRLYGVQVIVARLFNTYGPRMARFVVLDFLNKLQRDPHRLEILGDGRQRRDFTYVSDTVQGLMILAGQGLTGEAYNVSSGSSCSVTDVALELIRLGGLEGQTELAYTGSSWLGDAQRWEVSTQNLEALGYKSQVALREGLRRTMEWHAELARSSTPALELPIASSANAG